MVLKGIVIHLFILLTFILQQKMEKCSKHYIIITEL